LFNSSLNKTGDAPKDIVHNVKKRSRYESLQKVKEIPIKPVVEEEEDDDEAEEEDDIGEEAVETVSPTKKQKTGVDDYGFPSVNDLVRLAAIKILATPERSMPAFGGLTERFQTDAAWNKSVDALVAKWATIPAHLISPEAAFCFSTVMIYGTTFMGNKYPESSSNVKLVEEVDKLEEPIQKQILQEKAQ